MISNKKQYILDDTINNCIQVAFNHSKPKRCVKNHFSTISTFCCFIRCLAPFLKPSKGPTNQAKAKGDGPVDGPEMEVRFGGF